MRTNPGLCRLWYPPGPSTVPGHSKYSINIRPEGWPYSLLVMGARSHRADSSSNPGPDSLKNTLGTGVCRPKIPTVEKWKRNSCDRTMPYGRVLSLSSLLPVSLWGEHETSGD